MADEVFRLFDTASQSTVPLVRQPGGTVYIYTWTDEDKADDWRADGYRWRQGGSWQHKCEGGNMKKTYSKVSIHSCLLRRPIWTETAKNVQPHCFTLNSFAVLEFFMTMAFHLGLRYMNEKKIKLIFYRIILYDIVRNSVSVNILSRSRLSSV